MLKGSRHTGDKILLGGLPKIGYNFPLTKGSDYILFLQRDLSHDEMVKSYRYECPQSSLLRNLDGAVRPITALYTGYHDFVVREEQGQKIVGAWAYKGHTGWQFLDGYSFDRSVSAGPDRGGSVEITPYDKFMTLLERTIQEVSEKKS